MIARSSVFGAIRAIFFCESVPRAVLSTTGAWLYVKVVTTSCVHDSSAANAPNRMIFNTSFDILGSQHVDELMPKPSTFTTIHCMVHLAHARRHSISRYRQTLYLPKFVWECSVCVIHGRLSHGVRDIQVNAFVGSLSGLPRKNVRVPRWRLHC